MAPSGDRLKVASGIHTPLILQEGQEESRTKETWIPISTLPIEIVYRILECSVALPAGIDPIARTRLMLCCKEWFTAIGNGPIFWSHVRYHPKVYEVHSAAHELNRFLERSGNLPLIVSISLSHDWKASDGVGGEDQDGLQLIALVHQIVRRARSMWLILPSRFFPLPIPQMLSDIHSHIRILPLEQVTSLVQVFMDSPDLTVQASVRSLTLIARQSLAPSSFSPLGPCLSRLTLHMIETDPFSLFAVLCNLKWLEYLNLWALRGTYAQLVEGNLNPSFRTLTDLKYLKVNGNAMYLFARIDLPKLKCLQATHTSMDQLRDFLQHVVKTTPIEHLYISDSLSPRGLLPLVLAGSIKRVSMNLSLPLDKDDAQCLREILSDKTLTQVRLVFDDARAWALSADGPLQEGKKAYDLLQSAGTSDWVKSDIVIDISYESATPAYTQALDEFCLLMDQHTSFRGRIRRGTKDAPWEQW